jgi:predicted glycosyltransferase
MTEAASQARILMYSHDTFGLGHLRRARTIAHALVEEYSNLSVLILSGSPLIGSFDFKARVDFVRVPGVIKLRNGAYTSLGLHIDLDATMALRASIMEHTAEVFAPDVFIVDKEPWGLRGELKKTLPLLKKRGTRLVLGLRDVLDEATTLTEEWKRKGAFEALPLYDEIWAYGIEGVYDPLAALPLPKGTDDKLHFTGYLPRALPEYTKPEVWPKITQSDYLLVTPGGGGDGAGLVDWVLKAYEQAGADLLPALIVYGPFMPPEARAVFEARAAKLPMVETLVFDARIEHFLAKSSAVVAMGGYNTFCEILSHDKPALLVPRLVPRAEQSIRARRGELMGLCHTLIDPEEMGGGTRQADVMVDALKILPRSPRPSAALSGGALAGLSTICDRIAPYIPAARRRT